MRQKFLAAYDAKHQMTKEGDNKAIAIIGPEEFPFPIPLTRKGAACQRVPLPRNGYCPSHQHLAETEDRELAAA